MDVIIDAYLRSGNAKYSDLFTPWYEGIKVKMEVPIGIIFMMIWNGLPLLWSVYMKLLKMKNT